MLQISGASMFRAQVLASLTLVHATRLQEQHRSFLDIPADSSFYAKQWTVCCENAEV